MTSPTLSALSKAFREHGVVVLSRPSAEIRPGVLLDAHGEVLQHLTDLHDGHGGTFFTPLGAEHHVTMGALSPASFVLDEVVVKTGVGGNLGLDYMRLASVKAAARVSTEVRIRFGGFKLKRLQAGTDVLGGPAFLEGADYCSLATANLKWSPFKMLGGMMRVHAVGLPALFPRTLHVAQALVYAESVEYQFGSATQASIGARAAIPAVAGLDAEAGFDVSVGSNGTVTWHNGDAMPIGYVPVPYAYRPHDESFVLIGS